MGKWSGKRLGALVLSLALLAPNSLAVYGEESGETQVWISDWRDQTFRNTQMPQDAPAEVNLTVARNDTEPFQINVRPAQDGRITSVAFSNLVCGDAVLPAEQLSYHYVDYIRATMNSRYVDNEDKDAVVDKWGSYWVNLSNPIRRTSPDMPVAFPEILSNAQDKKVVKNKTQPIWVKVHIPANTQPGLYLGRMQVRTTFGNYDFNVNVDVKDVLIPDTASPESFSIEMWSQLVGNFDTEIDVINDAYGLTVDTPEWWALMGKFAALMKENRLNVMTVNQTDLLLKGKGTRVEPDGRVIFDWSFFNKFVDFFRQEAGIQIFSCGPLAKFKSNPLNYNNDVEGQEINDITQSFVEAIVYDPANPGVPKKQLLTVDLEAYENGGVSPAIEYVRQYGAALNSNLTSRGWKDIWYQHIIDEPGRRFQAALYPVLEKNFSDNCSIPTGDAFTVWTAEEQSAHTEVFSVMSYSLDQLSDKMKACMKEGDRLWVYTSMNPIKDNYLNRLIDQPVWNMELMGWFCYRQGATGYLHWGLNQWNTWTKNYEPFPDYPQSIMWDNVLGDGSCVYPDKENMDVRSSIRLEAVREASEVVSLLWTAEKKHPEEVRELLENILRSGTEYETDINKIRDARTALLNLASN